MKITMLEKRVLGHAAQIGGALSLPYAGKRIKVRIVDTIGGWYKPGYASTDALCRSKAGEYFLAREIYLDPLGEGEPRFRLPDRGYWVRVKRLSLHGAVLCGLRDCDEQFRADVLGGLACKASTNALLRELFALQKFCNEIQARTFGVSRATLEGAASYAAKHGRTLDEFIADALEMAAGSAPVEGVAKGGK